RKTRCTCRPARAPGGCRLLSPEANRRAEVGLVPVAHATPERPRSMFDTLLVKVVLTPALIGAASLAGRRFGPAVGGWFVGCPMNSAPITLFLALSHGPEFAAAAATGAMAGALSQAAFCLTWGWLAGRGGWPVALASSSIAFGISTAALRFLTLPA